MEEFVARLSSWLLRLLRDIENLLSWSFKGVEEILIKFAVVADVDSGMSKRSQRSWCSLAHNQA